MIIGILALLYFLYASKSSLLKKVDVAAAHSTRTIKLDDALFARAPDERCFKAAIGASVENIYNINLEDASFYASGYIYLRYTQVPSWLEDWDSEIYDSPVKSLAFTNAIFVDAERDGAKWLKEWKEEQSRYKIVANRLKVKNFVLWNPFKKV